MKKARLFLATIALSGLLAGVFAFKAYRSTLTIFTTTVYNASAVNAVTRATFTTAFGFSAYYTTIFGQPATNYSIVTTNVN